MLKIGFGYDIHTFTEDRPLILGGVEIPYIKGLAGHSDGDALIHAIIDSLLGAMGKGDIGAFFPDTDNSFKNISSITLLKKVQDMLIENRFKIINIDTTIVSEVPRFEPFKKAMIDNVAQALNLDKECLNVKAKTNERCDSIGQGEAIAAYAVVLIDKSEYL